MKRYSLITGACGGLGSAFVEILAERKEPLYLTGTSEARLISLQTRLRERFPQTEVKICSADLSDARSRAALFEQVDKDRIRFRRLIYVAGIDTQMAFEKYTEQKLIKQARVNFESAVSLTRAVMERSDLNGETELLAVGSMSASTPMPYFALYSATKKALEQFYVGLHEELKGRAKVTCVLPGGIPTREDIKENIRSHGFFGRVSAKSPNFVAQKSLAKLSKNKRKAVIGFWNKIIKLATDVVPMSVKMRFISKMWSKTEKDYYA